MSQSHWRNHLLSRNNPLIWQANFSLPEHVLREVDSLAAVKGEEGLAYYTNITGILRGNWFRIPELQHSNPFIPPESPPEEDFAFPKAFSAPPEWGNFTYRDTVTGYEGRFTLDISELTRSSTVQFVEAALTVSGGHGDNMFRAHLEGIHFPATGEVVLVSTTAKKYLISLEIWSVNSKV